MSEKERICEPTEVKPQGQPAELLYMGSTPIPGSTTEIGVIPSRTLGYVIQELIFKTLRSMKNNGRYEGLNTK